MIEWMIGSLVDCVFHGFECGADGVSAVEVGFADDLPADVIGVIVEDGLDIAVGEGYVQISEDEFLGGIAAIGVDGGVWSWHYVAECGQKTQKPLHGVLTEIPAQESRYVQAGRDPAAPPLRLD